MFKQSVTKGFVVFVAVVSVVVMTLFFWSFSTGENKEVTDLSEMVKNSNEKNIIITKKLDGIQSSLDSLVNVSSGVVESQVDFSPVLSKIEESCTAKPAVLKAYTATKPKSVKPRIKEYQTPKGYDKPTKAVCNFRVDGAVVESKEIYSSNAEKDCRIWTDSMARKTVPQAQAQFALWHVDGATTASPRPCVVSGGNGGGLPGYCSGYSVEPMKVGETERAWATRVGGGKIPAVSTGRYPN